MGGGGYHGGIGVVNKVHHDLRGLTPGDLALEIQGSWFKAADNAVFRGPGHG